MTTQRALSKELITEIEYAFNQNRQELKNIINQIIESTRQEERERSKPLIEALETMLILAKCNGKDAICDVCDARKVLEAYQSKDGEKKCTI